MRYLTFDLSDGDDGVATLEALAATSAEQHAAVMAEVQRLLDWAWQQYPHEHGAAEDGGIWDHDLQVQQEDGGWHAVTLTLSGSASFFEHLFERFPAARGTLADD